MPTSTTPVSICNQALSWLGAGLITSLDDSDSNNATLCKANYEPLRDAVIEDHEWSFALRRNKLLPLTDANGDWEPNKAFQIPVDVLRVIDASKNGEFKSGENLEWTVEDNKIITGNLDKVYIKSLVQVADTTKFSSKFAQALAARIALDLATPITESPDTVTIMSQLYTEKLASAAAADGLQGKSKRIRSGWMRQSRQGVGTGGVIA